MKLLITNISVYSFLEHKCHSPQEWKQILKALHLDLIIKHSMLSYCYAFYVLNGPFPEGEPEIAKTAGWSWSYARNVLKGKRFELGEPAIAKNALISYEYAETINDRFPLGEPVIYMRSRIAKQYEELCRKIDAPNTTNETAN